jgi:hypothetical protein
MNTIISKINPFKFGLFILAVLTLVSCKEEDLNLTPYSSISELSAFENPDLIALSVTGTYDAAQSGFYQVSQGAAFQVRGYPFGAASIEQGDCRGEDMMNMAAFYQITYNSTYDPTTANNVNMWNTLWGLINKANIVIDGVKKAAEKGIITTAKAEEYEGEMRFLRALSYHELMIHFAYPYKHTSDASHLGVPIRTIPVVGAAQVESEVTKPRDKVSDVYKFMIADLVFAEAKLPASRKTEVAGKPFLHVVRATKGAAIALKLRLYSHMWDWDGIINEFPKLTGYSLTAAPEGPFADNKTNTESIFSIENSDTDHPGVNGALGSMYNTRALVSISPQIWNQTWWLASDLRRTQLTKNGATTKLSNKYRDGSTYTDYTPIIRYAESVLDVAEAYARKGQIAQAVEKLNLVRNRAVTDVADQYTATTFTGKQAELITAILRERRIEFLGEGRRWADIHRLQADPDPNNRPNGVPAKVLNSAITLASYPATPAGWTMRASDLVGYTYSPTPDKRFLWPIPQEELLTNEVLKAQQNPGW